MFSLKQARRIRGNAGDPLPVVFESLDAAGTRLLLGQLVLVASGPGVGKSILALTLALKAGVTCMYFSADSDASTQLVRSIAVLRGIDVAQATGIAHREQTSGEPDELDELDLVPIRFNFRASPSLDDIEVSLNAYEEVYGEYPRIIVIDNITNVRSDASDDDPFSGLETLMDYFHGMARETQACVLVLHHVTGPFNDADKPVPMSGIKGQIGRVPELILTLHRYRGEPGYFDDTLCVSTVKNRGGKADPSGNTFVQLKFEPDKMRISDQDEHHIDGF